MEFKISDAVKLVCKNVCCTLVDEDDFFEMWINDEECVSNFSFSLGDKICVFYDGERVDNMNYSLDDEKYLIYTKGHRVPYTKSEYDDDDDKWICEIIYKNKLFDIKFA